MKLKKLVGTRQKVYYPYEQKFIERVIREDHKGLYINYKGERRECRARINDFGEVIGLEVLRYGRR